MGTNYYVFVDTGLTGADDSEFEELHIGKSSMGWVFSLRVYEDRSILSLYDWLPVLSNPCNTIRDEYGARITLNEMIRTITARSRVDPVNWSEADWKMNHAEPGPNNLVRHRQLSEYGRTVTHGEGTWDYMDYEFF